MWNSNLIFNYLEFQFDHFTIIFNKYLKKIDNLIIIMLYYGGETKYYSNLRIDKKHHISLSCYSIHNIFLCSVFSCIYNPSLLHPVLLLNWTLFFHNHPRHPQIHMHYVLAPALWLSHDFSNCFCDFHNHGIYKIYYKTIFFENIHSRV